MPVMPTRSLALPTCATQPAETDGSSGRWTRRSFIPFGRTCSSTFDFLGRGGASEEEGRGGGGDETCLTDGHGHLTLAA